MLASLVLDESASRVEWEDDDYFYMDVDLTSADGPDVDITVHEGRIHLRIALDGP